MTIEVTRKFTQRKRAKDACLALNGVANQVKVQVYIVEGEYRNDFNYIIHVHCPDEIKDTVTGMLSLGIDYEEYLDADMCSEFYQGDGLSRFRGAPVRGE